MGREHFPTLAGLTFPLGLSLSRYKRGESPLARGRGEATPWAFYPFDSSIIFLFSFVVLFLVPSSFGVVATPSTLSGEWTHKLRERRDVTLQEVMRFFPGWRAVQNFCSDQNGGEPGGGDEWRIEAYSDGGGSDNIKLMSIRRSIAKPCRHNLYYRISPFKNL